MKKLAIGLMTAGLVLGSATGARADVFSVSLDVPMQINYASSELSPDKATGYMFGLNTPFFLGIALEDYEISGKIETSTGTRLEYTQGVTFTDLTFSIPFPIVNIGLGAGVGSASFAVDPEVLSFDDAELTQYFVSLGLPIALVFDLHVGYRVISGKAPVSTGGSGEVDLDAELASFGVKFGF